MLRSAREVIILLCDLVFMLCNFLCCPKMYVLGGIRLIELVVVIFFFNNSSKVLINVVVTLVGDVVP